MSTIEVHHSSYPPGRRHWLFAVLGVAAALVTGCASPPKEVVTPVSLNLMADKGVNPDANGRASPLGVRVYALKSPSAFTSADFFSLYDKDTATLGADLVQREEVLLLPGAGKQLNFVLKPEAKAIGVIAAYRDLERAHWRELHMLDVGKPCNLELRFGALQIQVIQR